MVRDLTTVEKRGQKIRSKVTQTTGIITGAYVGGFVVFVEAENKVLHLPFENVSMFEVIEEENQIKP